jgi:hypothetical protein
MGNCKPNYHTITAILNIVESGVKHHKLTHYNVVCVCAIVLLQYQYAINIFILLDNIYTCVDDIVILYFTLDMKR